MPSANFVIAIFSPCFGRKVKEGNNIIVQVKALAVALSVLFDPCNSEIIEPKTTCPLLQNRDNFLDYFQARSIRNTKKVLKLIGYFQGTIRLQTNEKKTRIMSLLFKSSGLVVALGLMLSLSSPASAAVWRSQSGKTAIRGLDSICWGNSNLYTVHTAFGNTFYSGSASFNYVRNNGCKPGDTLIGNFNLKSANSYCDGTLTVTWQRGNNAYLKWDIANPGYNGCPVTNAHWEINTYPVADRMARPITSPTGAAFVFAPPSNVRASPNGTIICSVRSATTIDLYGQSNGWYKTDACGTMGFIHHSQIRF